MAAQSLPPTPSSTPSPPPKQPSRYNFVYQPVSNLVYQLDCLSGQEHCSKEAYQRLWQQLGSEPTDTQKLQQWQTLRQKYSRQVTLEEVSTLPLPIRFEGVDLWRKIRIAALNAESLADYRQKLSQSMVYRDSLELSQLLQHFWPRFDKWWQQEAEVQVTQVEAVVAQMEKAGLFRLIPKLQQFYNADIPDQGTLDFHFMWRPQGEPDGFFGEQVENHSIIELRPNQQLDYALGVVIHELCHYFFKSVAPAQQIALMQKFVNDADVDSLRAYNLLDEVLATTLGNGLSTQQLVSAERFQRYRQSANSFYSDTWIDPAAKALLDIIPNHLSPQQNLHSDSFQQQYLSTLKRVLPEFSGNLVLGLRTLGLIYEGSEGQEVAQYLQTLFKAGLIRTTNALDSIQAVQLWQQSSHLSGVLLVPQTALPKLKYWENLLGTPLLAELATLSQQHQGLVYGIQRNPKTHWYLVVGKNQEVLKQLVDALFKTKQAFTGPKIII